MKCISIREPWASIILSGRKTIEVRSWKTTHRGPLALHCSKKVAGPLAGKIFAIVELVDVRPLRPADKKHTGGFYATGHFAWSFKDLKKIKPVDLKGKLRLFDVYI